MKRYMTGMFTGALVGAVMAGMWIMRRRPQPAYRRALASAGRLRPQASRMMREIRKGVRRRIG